MPFHGFERTMACSRADLARWLTELTGSDHGIAASGSAELPFEWGVLRIDTRPLPPRRIALVKLQQLEVVFTPPAGGEAAAQAWLTRFDHHTQRGGG